MSHWFIETKKQSVCFLPFENKGVIRVSLHEKQKDGIHRSDDKTLEVVLIPLTDENVKKLQSYKSVSALFKYAKANALPTPPSEPTPPPRSRPPEAPINDDNVVIGGADGDTPIQLQSGCLSCGIPTNCDYCTGCKNPKTFNERILAHDNDDFDVNHMRELEVKYGII